MVCNIERGETLVNIDGRRDDLNKFLLLMEEKHSNIKVFDPNYFISNDVKAQLIDRDHFTPLFLNELQDKYSTFIQEILSDNN